MRGLPFWVILEKELKLELRFKFSFLFSSLIDPVINTFWFGLLYLGFFSIGSKPLWGVTREAFIPFLVVGGLVNGFFSVGFGVFSSKLLYEKFWKTIEAFLIVPISRFHLLLGYGLVEFIRMSFALLLFLGFCYWLHPTSGLVLLSVLLILVGLLMGSLGVGLIRGIFTLTNENILPAFNFLYWGWGFMSCFYYPKEILPRFIEPLTLVNPVYHAVTLIRHLWFDYPISSVFVSSLWILGFAILMPLTGVTLFNRLWKKMGIQGY